MRSESQRLQTQAVHWTLMQGGKKSRWQGNTTLVRAAQHGGNADGGSPSDVVDFALQHLKSLINTQVVHGKYIIRHCLFHHLSNS